MKALFNRRSALAAGAAFALTLSGMTVAPNAHAADATTGTTTLADGDVVEILTPNVPEVPVDSGVTVNTQGANGGSNFVSVNQKQSELDSLATGVNTDSNDGSRNGVLVAAIVAAIAGFAGAAALVGNFLSGDLRR
ncbi:MAG: hypothetical protein Q3962_06585 [Corynebacterium sp.]|nr:hypothetical protein [Corynebacterium sp.]